MTQGTDRFHRLIVFLIALTACVIYMCCTNSVYAMETNGYESSDIIRVDVPNTEYMLTAINGEQVSTLANGKPKILFFFNTTCPRCQTVESNIREYGMNLDNVDFIMAESSINGVTPYEAEEFYKTVGIESNGQCYDALDICWEYLRACGYKPSTTKKPVIIYISEDNEIMGYTWNYTNIYKAAQTFGITLETGDHEYEDMDTVDSETGAVTCCKACTVCGLKSERTIEKPKPEKTSFVYNGKPQSVLSDALGYTVVGGKATDAGEYKAVVYLDDSEWCTWNDGTAGHKVFKWTISKAEQRPVITTSSKTFKKASLKKKAKSFKLAVSGAYGKKTFKKISGSSRLKVDSRTGKVTVKKKTRKGTYTLKVRVATDATSNYEAGSSAVKTIKIKVK